VHARPKGGSTKKKEKVLELSKQETLPKLVKLGVSAGLISKVVYRGFTKRLEMKGKTGEGVDSALAVLREPQCRRGSTA